MVSNPSTSRWTPSYFRLEGNIMTYYAKKSLVGTPNDEVRTALAIAQVTRSLSAVYLLYFVCTSTRILLAPHDLCGGPTTPFFLSDATPCERFVLCRAWSLPACPEYGTTASLTDLPYEPER